MPLQLIVVALLGFAILVKQLTGPKKKYPTKRASGKPKSRSGERAELVSALRNLGYTKKEADARAARARGSSFDDLLRSALRK